MDAEADYVKRLFELSNEVGAVVPCFLPTEKITIQGTFRELM